MSVGVCVRLQWRLLAPCALALLAACGLPAAAPPARVDTAALARRFARPGADTRGRLYVLGEALAEQQQRLDALQAQLAQRTHEMASLRTEVQELRAHEVALRSALTPATTPAAAAATGVSAAAVASAGARVPPAAVPPAGVASAGRGAAPAGPQLAALRTQLAREHQRRLAAETALDRLKRETSTSPFANPAATAAELAAAKHEIVQLRHALADERDARAHLAGELATLQRQSREEAARTQADTAQNTDLRTRLAALETDKQKIVDSFQRSLAASQQRSAALEQELAAARSAAAPRAATAGGADTAAPAELTTIRAENAALRTRLDEEHRRTEDLANKLKVATRVTDLIFKLQEQQQGDAPAPVPPPANPWRDR